MTIQQHPRGKSKCDKNHKHCYSKKQLTDFFTLGAKVTWLPMMKFEINVWLSTLFSYLWYMGKSAFFCYFIWLLKSFLMLGYSLALTMVLKPSWKSPGTFIKGKVPTPMPYTILFHQNLWKVGPRNQYFLKNFQGGTSLVVQWLRLCIPKARGPGSIPGHGTRSHMSPLHHD